MRWENGITLRELINVLEKRAGGHRVEYGFTYPHSYRGYYECLAFKPLRDTTVKEMLQSANSAVGATYEGWKGGEYLMGDDTEVYIANVGDTGHPITMDMIWYMMGMKKLPEWVNL